jgi:amidohydrolase
MTAFLDLATPLADDLVALRRDFHRHPELSFREVETAARIVSELERLGLTPRTGVGRTGVVAEIGEGAPVVALRADMDALPIHEANDHDYRSRVDGVMHACGHDAHMTGLVGAARLLVAARDAGELPPGTVRLVFQPSEETADAEGVSGAPRMIADGVLEGVRAIVGLHVGAHMTPGLLLVGGGPVMGGSEEIDIVVRGRAAHAAMAHQGVDALVLASEAVVACQGLVARALAPTETGVVHFGSIAGGSTHNIVADEVRLRGTIRYFDADVGRRLREGIRAIFGGLEARGAEVDVAFSPPYAPVVNDDDLAAALAGHFEAAFGTARVAPQPAMLTAEDFGAYTASIPGVFFWLGAACARPRQHHHPEFDIDESVLPLGAAALAEAAVLMLRRYA